MMGALEDRDTIAAGTMASNDDASFETRSPR
jgi:hypothetical protein